MVKVFSFCLYGPPNPRYYPLSILQNIWLVGTHYPGWKVYLYTAPDVDQTFLDQVVMYSNVVIRPTGKLGAINMVERFFAIDEPDVDIMLVRDADSHVHWRDRWAINDFLSKPQYVAHIIRDNPEHRVKMMGGLWGLRKSAGLPVRDLYAMYSKDPYDWGIGHDQNFLSGFIYPYISEKALVHSSVTTRQNGEHAIMFPFPFTNDIFCGRNDDATTFRDDPEPPTKPVYPFLKFSR